MPGDKATLLKLHAYYDSIRVPSLSSPPAAGDSAPVKRTLHPEPNGEGPSLIHRTIHDTATIFKRYVRAVDGGILGDEELWVTLRACLTADDGIRGAARALFEVRLVSWRRLNFICVVFGVLAALQQEGATGEMRELPVREDVEDVQKSRSSLQALARRVSSLSLKNRKSKEPAPQPEPEPTEKITAEVLGAVFAPLLLGDKLVPADREADADYMRQRTKDSTHIVRFLVERWTEIVEEMRMLIGGLDDVFVSQLGHK